MSDRSAPGSSRPSEPPSGDRLDSWKEIATYLRRDVTTVQRWEKREGMPVHRHVHDKMGSVFAFRGELDAWVQSRNPGPGSEEAQRAALEGPERQEAVVEEATSPFPPGAAASSPTVALSAARRWPLRLALLFMAAAVAMAGFAMWRMWPREQPEENPLADARYSQLTSFGGTEHAAAISRDGRMVALLSDREGRMDVWVTQVGTGRFYNLTRDAALELVNPSVRTLGFSPDGTLVTFWTRRVVGSKQPDIGIWATPVLGGHPRPYLEGVAEFDWSADGARLVYHTPGPGDPMFVSDSGQQADARQIFSAPPGLHSHFVVWSPDQAYIYFVQGSLPDGMDIWRLPRTGGAPERITHHNSQVTHPVFLSPRTLAYLASDPDGSGPWLYSLDLERRIPRRVSAGIDRYSSLSASADGRRLVATRTSPQGTFWRLSMAGERAPASSARRIALRTSNGSLPRLGAGYLLYVSSKGLTDSIWRLQGDESTEVWSAPDARVIAGPAIARDDRRVAFTVRQRGRTLLIVANADGTESRVVTRTLDLRGAPAWAPDGRSIVVAAVVGGAPRLFSVPLDGGSPAPFIAEYSLDPVWTPDGKVVVFSGPDIGTAFPLKAVTADAAAYPLPKLTLPRGARRLAFLPGHRTLVTLRGEIRHKNLWLTDLDTGAERQLTDLPADFDVRDFDIAPDGREVVLEEVKERSDIVLLDVPQR